MNANEPYQLLPSKFFDYRCDKCGRGRTAFVFKCRSGGRWQRRCLKCAERMVAAGKAKMPQS